MNPDRAPQPDASELMPRPRGEGRETARLESFSDGVFAIAITLLILSVPVPTGLSTGDELLAALKANGSAFAAYAISFATILIMWVNHHSVFKQVARVDRPFLMLNGLLLMVVTFLNYPTELIAHYLTVVGKDVRSEVLIPDPLSPGVNPAQTAMLVYSATLILIAVLFNALWFYAAHGGRLLADDADPRVVHAISRAYRFGPLYYVVTFVIAYFSPVGGLLANAALAVYFAVFGRDAF
jgi:uncharacterized membrane protein